MAPKTAVIAAAVAAGALAAAAPAAADCAGALTAYAVQAAECGTAMATIALDPVAACASECVTQFRDAYVAAKDACADDTTAQFPDVDPMAMCDGAAGEAVLPQDDAIEVEIEVACLAGLMVESMTMATDADCTAMTEALDNMGDEPSEAAMDAICKSPCKGTLVSLGKKMHDCTKDMSADEMAAAGIEVDSNVGETINTMCVKSGGEYCTITAATNLGPCMDVTDTMTDACANGISLTSPTCLNVFWSISAMGDEDVPAVVQTAFLDAGASEPSPAASTVASPAAAVALAGAAALAMAALA